MKLFRINRIISKLRYFIPQKTLLLFYYALFQPTGKYAYHSTNMLNMENIHSGTMELHFGINLLKDSFPSTVRNHNKLQEPYRIIF